MSLRPATLAVALLTLCACTHHATPGNDAGPGVPDASNMGCPGPSSAGYVPAAWVAPRAARNDCTGDELDSYWDDCIQIGALPIACQQFNANHAACAKCLAPDPATGAGPLRAMAGSVIANVGGCIALVLNDARLEGCGARDQVARDCASFVCAQCSGGSTCPTDARQGACAAQQMNTCAELAMAMPCALNQDPRSDYRRIAALFCAAAASGDN